MMAILLLSLITSIAAGDAAMAKGDYAAAAHNYRAEVEANPGSYEARFKLAKALSFSNQREEAIRLYTELLATRPDNSDLLLGRGRTFAWEHRWDEAETDLVAATSLRPGYGEAWRALGDVYLWTDRPGEAVNAYGKWIEASPGDPGAYIARARAHRSAGEFEAARADFEEARLHGAPDEEVDRYLTSLRRRIQEPESGAPDIYTWLATLSYGINEYSPDSSDWRHYTVTLRRYFARGSLGFEYLGSSRFRTDDYALALDAYVDLWRRAYANLRYQYSPDAALYPDHSYRVEIFQGAGKGWELSGSYDHMDFGKSNVDMYGVGIGKYRGNWYLRWRTLFIPSEARLGISNRALARYYYAGNGDDYFEVNAGFSHGGEFLRGTTIVETTNSFAFGAVFQKYFTPHWGIKVSAGYDDDEESFTEHSLAAKLLVRW